VSKARFVDLMRLVTLLTPILVVLKCVVMPVLSSQGEVGGGQLNIYGRPLSICSSNPMTGWYRDGYARTDQFDHGSHVVCAQMTNEFLDYTKSLGNDLSTPRGGFPGLVAGNRWALCAVRWREALVSGVAPRVLLEATNVKALDFVTVEQLESRALIDSGRQDL